MDFSPLLFVQALLIMGVFMDIVDAGKKNTIQVKSQKCIRNHLTIEPKSRGVLNKVLYGVASHRGPTPYRLLCTIFGRKGTPFLNLLLTNGALFTYHKESIKRSGRSLNFRCLRPVSNVVLVLCRTQLIELN